jgi:hypothetical protein
VREVSMKKFLLIIVLVICHCTSDIAFGQNNREDISNKISQSIRNGNSSELANYLSSTIELTIPGNEGTYSNSQAEMIIRDFFTNYKPKSFTIKNKGNSKPGDEYVIGELVTSKAIFRTYWLLKKMSGKYYIQQLKFEKQ